MRVTHAFLPLLRKAKSPRIINVSSGLGSFATTHDLDRVESTVVAPLYAASKAAVTMLSTQYAKALKDVRVNAVDPGDGVATPRAPAGLSIDTAPCGGKRRLRRCSSRPRWRPIGQAMR